MSGLHVTKRLRQHAFSIVERFPIPKCADSEISQAYSAKPPARPRVVHGILRVQERLVPYNVFIYSITNHPKIKHALPFAMNRSELIVSLAKRFPNLTQKDAQIAVDLMLDAIADAMVQKRRAEIRGFGSFTVHYRPKKVARNPKTGAPVLVPEKHAPHFKPGKGLLEAIQPKSVPETLRLAA